MHTMVLGNNMKRIEIVLRHSASLLRYAVPVAFTMFLPAVYAENTETFGVYEHLETDYVIIGILLSNTLLLIGFLIRFRYPPAGRQSAQRYYFSTSS